MDGVSLSDVPRIVLLLSIPILLVGVPTYWAVYHRASFDRINRRLGLNRGSLFVVIFIWWAIEEGRDRHWIRTAICCAGAVYFLWQSRRRRDSTPDITTP